MTWANGTLLLVNEDTQVGGPSGPVQPGDAAEYRPDRQAWTRLARAPSNGPGMAPGIWTGEAVLYWGIPAGKDGQAPAGMEFVP